MRYPLILLLAFSRISFGGYATNPAPDGLKATENTRYYWAIGETVFEGKCRLGELISLENCGGDDREKRKNFPLSNWKALLQKGINELYGVNIQKRKFLEAQIALHSAANPVVPEKLEQLRDELAKYPTADTIFDSVVAAVTGDPQRVDIEGDGGFKEAVMAHRFLVNVFLMIPPEFIQTYHCTRGAQGEPVLWMLHPRELIRNALERSCNELSARVPTSDSIADRFSPKTCTKFATSKTGQAIPVKLNSGSHDFRYLWVDGMTTRNSGRLGNVVGYSENGEIFTTMQEDYQRAFPAVCVRRLDIAAINTEMRETPQFFPELPCGDSKTTWKTLPSRWD